MIKVFQWIYTAYSALIFATLLMIFGLFILIPLVLHPKGDRISFFFIRLWAGGWAFLSGIRFEVHGQEVVERSTPYIYIFNHRSFIDAPLIALVIPQRIRAIGKKELTKIPIFGLVVSKLAVWVDRSDPESRKASLEKLILILRKGISVVVSPEGTRNNTPETLLPFHKGAFLLSIETQTPIIEIAVLGADHCMKRGSLLLRPGKIKVYFSKPLLPPAPSTTAVEEFSTICRNRLEAMILAHE